MTPKQILFAEQYVIDHCGAAAAVRAGYAPGAARQTAYELLAKPEVSALVAEHERGAAKQLTSSRERVVTEIKAAIAMAREQQDPAAMIAGWREIAKLCGYCAPERSRYLDALGPRVRGPSISRSAVCTAIGSGHRRKTTGQSTD
jgi:phage terminase small subunit